MTPPKHKVRITVPGSAIDALGHVNNLVYLQWCLEAAEGHWKLVASESLQQHYVWYVLRHSIDYKNEAFLGEELLMETWVASADGVRSERQYQLKRLDDDKILIEAQTLWCLLDASTHRPAKITEEIRALFQYG